jgi:pyruvate dehydrogenase E2 component (dihydrolipoamide acetyltransferase)
MPVEIVLPRVDMDMERAKFSHWFVEEGARVEKGRPLFEIETDKAAMEVDAPASGWLREVSAKPGDVLPVGAVIAQIYAEGEAAAPLVERPDVPTPAVRAEAPPPLAAKIDIPAAGSRPRGTPKARRLAREAGVELAAIDGSGPWGRVQARDIPNSPCLARAACIANGWRGGSAPRSC